MRHLLPISCLLVTSGGLVCFGQDQFVTFGVKAGVPATPALPGLVSSNEYLDTGRWTVGPSIELHLISGLSFEADALFRGYTTFLSFAYVPSGTSQGSPLEDTYKASVKAWDFPFLAKYRFTAGAIRPFVDGGFQLTHESTDTFASSSILPGTNLSGFTDFNGNVNGSRNLHGPVGGVGVEFRYHRFKFDPEIRYYYSTADKNQLTVLVGVSF